MQFSKDLEMLIFESLKLNNDICCE